MSFDPQNPRGAPRSSPAPTPSYVPPQPVDRRPTVALLAAVTVIVLVVLVVVLFLIFNGGGPQPTLSPSAPLSTLNPSAPASAGAITSVFPPTNSASLPPTPVGSPSTPYGAFLLHVPADIRSTCTQGQSSDQQIQFSTQCTTATGIVVTYNQYDTADDMNAAYQQLFGAAQIDPNSGSCEDYSTWPAEGAYEVDGAPAGHRLCTNVAGAPQITWTDDRLDMLSFATGQAADVAGLIEFWTNDAGPNL